MTILELLEAHRVASLGSCGSYGVHCKCGHEASDGNEHRAHVAEVLEAHVREKEAAALEEAAEQIRRMTLDDNPTDWLLDRAEQARSAKQGQPDYAELFCRSMLSYSAEEYAPFKAEFDATQREDNQ